MGTLKEDIKNQSNWIVKAFKADKLKLDYSLSSFIEIDKFFNRHTIEGKAKPGGRLYQNMGPILFSIASYIVQTINQNIQGSILITDDNAADGELTIALELPNGLVIYPVQRVMKRFKNGEEDSIYVYGYHIFSDVTGEKFDNDYWEKIKEKKKWWQFYF